MDERYKYTVNPGLLKSVYCFSVSFTRPGNIILKFCIGSGSRKINFWVEKLISNLVNILGLSYHSALLLNFL